MECVADCRKPLGQAGIEIYITKKLHWDIFVKKTFKERLCNLLGV
ncbi:hypothetical protein HMPREF9148_01220 [Prevotella sp. F0091]|nr:hypothetical protein HMPREF9148_01220 [Prevotella sp. F0091]